MPAPPYVVGQWVRGPRFYGREALLREVLDGPRNWLWLLGTRRVGKTSLLRQLEHLTDDEGSGYVPVYWDFQGSDTLEELAASFGDAVLDAEERLESCGVEVDCDEPDLFRALNGLRRQLRTSGRTLLLLCDEVEELIRLDRQDPSLLRKLRRVLQSQEDIRTVMASTIRLWALTERSEDTSPFLHGFLPPLVIGPMPPEESRALVRQMQLPEELRPELTDDVVERIATQADGHPYLMQLLAKRLFETDGVDEAIDQIATDPMVSYFFSVDFDLLSETEQRIIRLVGCEESSTSRSIAEALSAPGERLDGLLSRLEGLGFLRREADRRYVLANSFFRRWFRDREAQPSSDASGSPAAYTVSLHDAGLPVPPKPGDVLDERYELIEQVGHGATGAVFRARDRVLRGDVAVKLLRPEYAAHPEAFDRFRQEVVLSREIVHPNVVTIYHLGDGPRPYLTMKWIDGTTLAELIETHDPLEEQRVLEIAERMAHALEALHARQVLHRDIKPHNILIDRDGAPHLTDFGLARLLGQPGMTSAGVFLGTPSYASPEQARLDALDERSDVYALGLVIYEMATGTRAFDAGTGPEVLEMQRTSRPRCPRELNPNLSEGLRLTILRCLEKAPERRYSSAAELRAELLRLGADGTVTSAGRGCSP